MDEKKAEELQGKIGVINRLADDLNFYKEQIKETMDFLEMLDNFNCNNIQIEGTDNEGEYKHNLFCSAMVCRNG
jgi:hypothetical protein